MEEAQLNEMGHTISKSCAVGMMKLLKQTIKMHDVNRNHYELSCMMYVGGGMNHQGYSRIDGSHGISNQSCCDLNWGNKPFL